MTIDGDEFSENDYGLVVDYSDGVQQLKQQLDTLAQAALQNQSLSFSTIMRLYNSSSLAEKQRLVEKDEKDIQERNAQQQQAQIQAQQQAEQLRQQTEMAKLESADIMNQRDNETRILVAEIGAQAKNITDDGIQEPETMSEADREKLRESIRQFDLNLQLEREKLEEDKRSNREDEKIRRIQANKKPSSSK